MAVVSYEEFFSIGRGHSLLGLDPSYTLFFTFAKFSGRCNRPCVSDEIDAKSHVPVRQSGRSHRCHLDQFAQQPDTIFVPGCNADRRVKPTEAGRGRIAFPARPCGWYGEGCRFYGSTASLILW